MITTLTLNPSVDRTVRLDRLRVGEVQTVLEAGNEPGGKGVNIARALATNGTVTAAIFPGDPVADADFRAELEPLGVTCHVVGRAQRTRSNLSITEHDGTTTKLNEQGAALDPAVLDALLEATVAAEGTGRIAAAGSVPGGTDVAVYAELAKRLGHPERSLAVDTSGAALAALVDMPCAVAKPNLEELRSLVDDPLETLGAVVDAATDLRNRGWSSVLVSLGPDGAVLIEADGVHHGRSTVSSIRNTVGAGDAMLAGYLASDGTGPEALAEGLAWANAAVCSPGTAAPPVGQHDRQAVELHATIARESLLTEAP